ncbi:hypothetical protein [Vibrio phage LV6]|nr:hypothetical protein [Vibrio phage LV6]
MYYTTSTGETVSIADMRPKHLLAAYKQQKRALAMALKRRDAAGFANPHLAAKIDTLTKQVAYMRRTIELRTPWDLNDEH